MKDDSAMSKEQEAPGLEYTEYLIVDECPCKTTSTAYTRWNQSKTVGPVVRTRAAMLQRCCGGATSVAMVHSSLIHRARLSLSIYADTLLQLLLASKLCASMLLKASIRASLHTLISSPGAPPCLKAPGEHAKSALGEHSCVSLYSPAAPPCLKSTVTEESL